MAKRKYSAKEKAAYYKGIGFAAKSSGKTIKNTSKREQTSFKRGMAKVKGK